MKRKNKIVSEETKKLNFIKNMPPLYHTLPNQEFDIRNSEVIKWLINQPVILQIIFDLVQNRSIKNELIKYNPYTKKWQGINYNE